ncbi:MAG TPA: hypothetical protein VF335_09060 [Chitinivibrionales bacterium]
MSRRIIFLVLFAAALQCAAPIKQFYPGVYFEQDRTYQNKSLGFSFSFRGNWNVFTNPNEMKENKSNAVLLHETGGELLFIGYTVEQTQGTRGIVVNLNEPVLQYAQEIQKLNADERQVDSGLTEMSLANIPMVKWIYEKGGFTFAEFFFKVDTYNIRIAFWTKPRLFPNFLSVYEEMIGTLALQEH